MVTAVSTGMTSTATGPADRKRLDMVGGPKQKINELGCPIVKIGKKKKTKRM
uniref:Uncharacterized protein n=1 Tax=viral metagenome TaxID=1070528 RepID=A0A6M3LNT8_9ZZZZ